MYCLELNEESIKKLGTYIGNIKNEIVSTSDVDIRIRKTVQVYGAFTVLTPRLEPIVRIALLAETAAFMEGDTYSAFVDRYNGKRMKLSANFGKKDIPTAIDMAIADTIMAIDKDEDIPSSVAIIGLLAAVLEAGIEVSFDEINVPVETFIKGLKGH